MVLSVAGLFFIFAHEPNSGAGWEFGEGLFGVLQTVLTTTLSIGGLTLIFELFLRESYAADLFRFLRLRSAVVGTGLQDVAPRQDVDWKSILEGSATIHALLRDPGPWVIPNLEFLLNGARTRATAIYIGMPDPSEPHFELIAQSLDLTPEALKANCEAAVAAVQNRWSSARPALHPGSSIQMVPYPEFALYEIVTADDTTVCSLTRPVDQQAGDYSPTFSFVQGRDRELSHWMKECVAGLEKKNPTWAG